MTPGDLRFFPIPSQSTNFYYFFIDISMLMGIFVIVLIFFGKAYALPKLMFLRGSSGREEYWSGTSSSGVACYRVSRLLAACVMSVTNLLIIFLSSVVGIGKCGVAACLGGR